MTEPEFSRPLAVDSLGKEAVTRKVTAEPAELEALARRLSLVDLKRLETTFTVERRSHGTLIFVEGALTAEPVQTCVVTLEPFVNPVDDMFDITFTTDPVASGATEVEIDPENPDEPEPLVGGVIDLGELSAQFLSLALDPHPRKPGVSFEYREDEPADAETKNPFSVLEQLRRRE